VGVDNQIYIYDGVDHAFANPFGERYASEESKDAWDQTIAFLELNLK
jgi:carboxymethylenebutenolidase